MLTYGIHWFRRDLRVAGNPALAAQLERHAGRVVGVYCIDPAEAARPDFSPSRQAFALETLKELRDELRGAGSELLVLEGDPVEAFRELLAKVRAAPRGMGAPLTWSWNREYEPFARLRDSRVEA